MWRYTLLGSAVFALASSRVNNSSTTTSLSTGNVPKQPSSITTPPFPSASARSSNSQDASSPSPSLPTLSSSSKAEPTSISSNSLNGTAMAMDQCTGCILQAYSPVTTFYQDDDPTNPWTSVVVTETVLTKFITYFDHSKIDTIVTESQTLNQTKTITGNFNQTVTHTTPHFVIEPTPGVLVTLEAGPTFVIYNDLYGGLDSYVQNVDNGLIKLTSSCAHVAATVTNWQPTATSDWNYFIETYTGKVPQAINTGPVPLPAKVIGYMKQETAIVSEFHGSDIATCTQRPRNSVMTHIPDPNRTRPEVVIPPPETDASPQNRPHEETTTGTFISTSFASTSTHETRQGCLRCQNTDPALQPSDAPVSDLANPPSHPSDSRNGGDPGPVVTIGNTVLPIKTGAPTQQTDQPNTPNQNPSNQNPSNQNPSNQNPSNQNPSNQNPPVIVIGTDTFTPGQTKTINGVQVVAPSVGSGSSLIVGGSTIAISLPGPTGPPIIVVESKPITADSQGQFVIGTQTLTPGGPAITDNGNTFSLGPSGTVAVINGMTTTLANAPAPTPAPVLVVNGQTVSANVDKGTTQFVIAPGQTLAPGVVLTVSGTTYSMPASASGSVVVINGVTSTLASPAITAAPALTIDGKSYSAVVNGGTTQYVLGTGTTLKPGDAVTISGTTYSLDPKGTALVINGQTSTIPRLPATNSANITMSSSSRSTFLSTTTSGGNPGEKIASGIGQTKNSKAGAAALSHGTSFDKWVEGLVIGGAGWLLMWL